MDSGQNDGRVHRPSVYEYLRWLLSDWPLESVWSLAIKPGFKTRLTNLCLWYEIMTMNLHNVVGLPMTHPPLRSALRDGQEFLLRALCNAELSPEASVSFRLNDPRLIRINGRVLFFIEIERLSAKPYPASQRILTFCSYADRYKEDEAGAADGGGRCGSDEN